MSRGDRRGKVIRKTEGGRIWWIYEVFIYENRTMKPVEIVLRRGKEKRNNNIRVNLFQVHCEHICKCHNESPMYNNYMLIK
jgi:hypothetical protein